MGKHPQLDALDKLFDSKNTFSLTDRQYEKLCGIPLPKYTYYLLNRSALAEKCRERGFALSVREKVVTFEKESK